MTSSSLAYYIMRPQKLINCHHLPHKSLSFGFGHYTFLSLLSFDNLQPGFIDVIYEQTKSMTSFTNDPKRFFFLGKSVRACISTLGSCCCYCAAVDSINDSSGHLNPFFSLKKKKKSSWFILYHA